MDRYDSREFFSIIDSYYNHSEVQKLSNYKHHGITRLDHSLRVAFYTYVVTKYLGLNYKDATVAALLHDFFLDEVVSENGI